MKNHLLEIIDEKPSFDTPFIFNNDVDTTNVKNLLLIDSIVAESQLFFYSSNQNTFSVIYSNNSNREDFIQLLENKFSNGLERIAFVFHDNIKDGKTFLNQELFFSEDFNSYLANTQLLIDIIKKFGVKNIDFLACNSLNYENWVKFYDMLAKETGVIVGASNDKTGNLKNGGDWVMENTNENVVSTYFNSNIENYSSTLAVTITKNGGFIYIFQIANTIYYYSDGPNSVPITSWPVTFVNSNAVEGNILTILITTNLTISNETVVTGTNGYFITGSNYITYDGIGNTVTIANVSAYLGLIQNGSINTNGYHAITVKNINSAATNSFLISASGVRPGWICGPYFGRNIKNINGYVPIIIDNCSNSGIVNNSSTINSGFLNGGICAGAFCYNGEGYISNCSNSGTISGQYAGGICGGLSGQQYGSVSITNCSNSGSISGQTGGGITGSQAGQNNGTVTITNCINSGVISGDNAGGICGRNAGYTNGTVSISNSTNSGFISGQWAGGICSSTAGYTNGTVSISNCTNTGAISGVQVGGIVGAEAGENNGTVSITNCYNTGTINGNFSGGITSNSFGYNTNNLCSIINCYNTGSINGYKAGGINGSEVGYNNNAIYTPKILIQNCYSLGNIASTAGGICGGTGITYTNTPIINIINCYTCYNSIVDSGSQYIATSLPIKNSIILTNVYTSLINSWSDTSANSALSGALNIYRNSRLYKYYSNFGEVWYSNQNNTPFSFTSDLDNVPRRKERRN